QRWLHAGGAEIALGPPVLRQDRQLAKDQGELTVAAVLEVEADPAWSFGDDLFHVGVITTIVRRALADQGFEGEYDVFGRDRFAVMKTRLRSQMKTYPLIVRAFLDLLGQQAIDGEGLVETTGGQGVVDQADVVGSHALVDEGIERVEAAKAGLAQYTAFGCIRIDVLEMAEIGGVLRLLVVQRHRVFGRCGRETGQKAEAEDAGLQDWPT